jgi:hypothetical protein
MACWWCGMALLGKLAKELIECETLDARVLVVLIEKYAADEIYFEEPSLNRYQRR